MKQTQKIILPTLLALSLLFPMSVNAIATAVSQNRVVIQQTGQEDIDISIENRQEVHQEAQENRASVAAEKKSLINQLKLQLIQTIQNRIRARLQNRFERLQKVQTTLEAKIQQRIETGQDTSAVETELAKAVQYKTNYQSNLASYDDVVAQMNSSDTPVKFRNELNQQARLANQELNHYLLTLKQATRLLINLGKI